MRSQPYYVYELSDPRDNTVFYVGKGTRNRCSHHEIEARKGSRTAKCRKIRDILNAGLNYRVTFVREFRTEKAAYAFEARLIEKRGLNTLTNIFPGGKLEWEKKADPELTHIITRIHALAILARHTLGFRAHVVDYAGTRIEYDIKALRRTVGDIIAQYGWEWTAKQFKRHKLGLETNSSKLEENGLVYG